jgi:hypothetical protein
MGVIVSSGGIEGFYWARLASFIIFHHQDPFRTSLSLVSLHSDDFRNFELLWSIF